MVTREISRNYYLVPTKPRWEAVSDLFGEEELITRPPRPPRSLFLFCLLR